MALSLFFIKLLIRSGLARYLPGIQRLTDGGADFLPYYGDAILTAPRAELKQAAVLVETPPPEVIDLSLGVPRFDAAMGLRLPAERHELPPPAGLSELRAAVAEHLFCESRLDARAPDEVLITPGAAGALHAVLDAFINPGDRVLLFAPCSPLFPLALRAHRARVNWLSTWAEEGRLRFRLDELERALRRVRLLILCSPNNPSGGLAAPEDLEQIAWWADRHNVLIVSDESFGRFCYQGERVSIGTLPMARRRTLTLGSVSKGHALASQRVGWIAGHRHLVRPCLLAGVLRTTFVPTVCQQLAAAALRQPPQSFEPVRSDFEARRRYVFERLTGMGLKPDWPAGGYFFWVPVAQRRQTGRAFVDRLLRERQVQVTPGDLFGPGGTGHVRISYATEQGRLREGLSRLAEFLRGRDENTRAA